MRACSNRSARFTCSLAAQTLAHRVQAPASGGQSRMTTAPTLTRSNQPPYRQPALRLTAKRLPHPQTLTRASISSISASGELLCRLLASFRVLNASARHAPPSESTAPWPEAPGDPVLTHAEAQAAPSWPLAPIIPRVWKLAKISARNRPLVQFTCQGRLFPAVS